MSKAKLLDFDVTQKIEKRFWARVNKQAGNNCWEWQTLNRRFGGYASISINGKPWLAHRAGWVIQFGSIPNEDTEVCHSCDNPSCVRLEHLFLASHKTNMRDSAKKGRLPFGSKQPLAKLNEKIVITIKKLYKKGGFTYTDLAKKFEVSVGTISLLMNNKLWKHVNYKLSKKQRKRILLQNKMRFPEKFKHAIILTKKKANKIKKLYNTEKYSISNLALKFNVGRLAISRIVNNHSWK